MLKLFLKGPLNCLLLLALLMAACTADTAKADETAVNAEKTAVEPAVPAGSAIKIEPNSPADTVRAFYNGLREKRYREAIFLTNLRPAIEGLTDAELKEFAIDLERIGSTVPANVVINGEIISGDRATVTVQLPGEEPEKLEVQQIELRRSGNVWVILTVDETDEERIKKEGRNYFYALRIQVHEDDARKMLDRIAKAQMAFAAQNGGKFTGIEALVGAGLLPADIKTSESTGYTYDVKLAEDGGVYSATATPAEYGKSGRLSFLVTLKGKNSPSLTSSDNGGKPMEK